MFDIVDACPPLRDPRLNRRSYLQIGSLGLAGLPFADLMAHRAVAASRGAGLRDTVLLLLQGGPPQHETFDPKMTAPEIIHQV
jgi:hypothetical protein